MFNKKPTLEAQLIYEIEKNKIKYKENFIRLSKGFSQQISWVLVDLYTADYMILELEKYLDVWQKAKFQDKELINKWVKMIEEAILGNECYTPRSANYSTSAISGVEADMREDCLKEVRKIFLNFN